MSNKKNNKIVLLDSHAILHRAYHALPDFASSKGEPTGALYGLSTMLLSIIRDFDPDYIFACFDLPKPTYRHEAYDAYKSGRKKTDEELVSQIIKSRELFEAFSIPCFEKEGFEADDLLGTIVGKLKDQDFEIIIASGDMDTLQLVSGDKVKVFTLKKGIKDTIVYSEKEVVERFGFLPKFLPDYKGLRGDPSDNIIGIKGIGEKTAESLIGNFETIEKIYEIFDSNNLDEFKKIGIKDRVLELLRNGREDAEFSKMLATIRRDAPIDFFIPEKTWKQEVLASKIKAFFTEMEFRSLGARIDDIFEKKQIQNDKPTLFSDNKIEEKVEVVDEVLLRKMKIALWLLNSSITNPELVDIYNFTGCNNLDKASEVILNRLKSDDLFFVYENIELPLLPIVDEMEERGVMVDLDMLKNLSKEYKKSLLKIEKEIFDLAGEEFNVASPKQLGEILFGKLGLKVKGQKKTSGGALSTKESELEKLKDEHPVIPLILSFRELAKLLSTYIDTIPKLLDKENRLHAKFLQAGTTTGRMSSESPNLQNIPIKTELGRNIRKAFVAPKNMKLLALDYSQIELRIAAILSMDEKLIEIFKKGEDIHNGVASQIFKVPIDKVDKEMRRKAKVINFGILYGMGINALKANLQSTREEAQEFYDTYFNTFIGLARYIDDVKNEAGKIGYTKTFFGRRRYFEGLKSKLPHIKAASERMAINAPIQGSQADIVKLAMSKIDNFLIQKKLKKSVYLILQIHDELIYEVSEDVSDEIILEIKKIMESVLPSNLKDIVPIIANASTGKNWGELMVLKV